MSTECNPAQLEFHALGCRDVVGRFDGGRITGEHGKTATGRLNPRTKGNNNSTDPIHTSMTVKVASALYLSIATHSSQ
jgi:hypothetical protein